MFLTELENELFKNAESGTFSMSLPQAAFIASGVDSSQLEKYINKFFDMITGLRNHVKGHDKVKNTETIFDWLWEIKPNRYELDGNFRLTQVVDAQLDETERVGNCLGLTILYNSLAKELNLSMKAAHLDNFMGHPHVFSILYTEMSMIPIENIFPDGFDYDPHKLNSQLVEWDNIHLIADLYNSRANEEGDDELRMKRDLLLSYTLQDNT